MKKIYFTLLVLSLAIGLCAENTASEAAIDWNVEFQTIDGFGTSTAFNKASCIRQVYEIDPVAGQRLLDLLFDHEKGIGLSIIRPIIGDGGINNATTKTEWGNRWYDGPSDTIEPEEGQYVWDQPGWNDPQAPNYKGNFDKDNVWLCQKAIEYGVKTFYADAWTPPYWMKQNNSVVGASGGNQASGTQSDRIKDGYYDDYADYLIQFALGYYREFGIHITHIGPSNESEAAHTSYSGFRINASQYKDLLLPEIKRELQEHAADFAELGIAPPIIVAPEGTNLNASVSTYGPLMNTDEAKETIGVFSTHLYGTSNFNSGPLTAGASAYPTWLRDYKLWQTEYMTQNNSSSASSANTQVYANQTITDGVSWADLVSNMLASDPGFSAWIWWWAAANNGADGSDLIRLFTSGSPQGNGSTITGVYRVFKRFYTFGNFSRFVKPGFVRIGATRVPSTGMNITAYKEPVTEKYAIVAVNKNQTDQELQFNLNNFPTGTTAVVGYLTNASENQKKMDPIAIVDNKFTVKIPLNSVITFVPQSSDNLPGLDTNHDIFSTLEAEDFDEAEGDISIVAGRDNLAVDGLKNSDYLKFANMDFADGSSNGGIVRRHLLSMNAIVKAPLGGIIEARIDDPVNGKLVGRFRIVEGNENYQVVSTQINTGDNAAQKFHDFYLVFNGPEESVFSVDRFEFGEQIVATDIWGANRNLLANGCFELGSETPRRPSNWTTISGSNTLVATTDQNYSAITTATNSTTAYSVRASAGAGVSQDVTTALAGKDGLKMQIIAQFMPTTYASSINAQVKLVFYNGNSVVDSKVIASREINHEKVTYGNATQKVDFFPWFWFQLDSVFTYEESTLSFTKVQIEFTDNTSNDLFIDEASLTVYGFAPVITTSVLNDGAKDTSYDPLFLTANGEPSNFAWTIETGNLPNGLTLNPSTGEISGTPTASGTYTFSIGVSNGVGKSSKSFSIVIGIGSAIDSPASEDIHIYTADGKLHVEANENAEICIYTTTGSLYIRSNIYVGLNSIPLPQGVFVVKINGIVRKVVN